jgi:hypothetical protein
MSEQKPMIELLLSGLAGGVLTYAGVAMRQRVPGEPWRDTIFRPFGAGGPGPRR